MVTAFRVRGALLINDFARPTIWHSSGRNSVVGATRRPAVSRQNVPGTIPRPPGPIAPADDLHHVVIG
jgi:hypothetical protein